MSGTTIRGEINVVCFSFVFFFFGFHFGQASETYLLGKLVEHHTPFPFIITSIITTIIGVFFIDHK